MPLTVLNVAYPFAPVGPGAVGGAEQILTRLDEALVAAGHTSLVLACEGSRVRGTLLGTALPADPGDEANRQATYAAVRATLARALCRYPVDVVHLHGIDCHSYLPQRDVPTLVTLHLDPGVYADELFCRERQNLFLQCVSETQRALCPPAAGRLLPTIHNGVALDQLWPSRRKRGFVLLLGRISPEKGFHLAIAAARRAGVPLVLAGKVYPYASHLEYFRTHIAPHMDGTTMRFVGPVHAQRKRRLLAEARCLLVPSQTRETSSLVAMEALACGTPVVAFRAGALPEIVEHQRTGLLVDSVEEMADAIQHVDAIDPAVCRREAEQRFSAARMTASYLAVYEQLAGHRFAPSRRRLELEELTSRRGLETLRTEWLALWRQVPNPSVFQHPDWLIPWCVPFDVHEPWLLALRRAGRLVGIAPLLIYPRGTQRVLTLMGAGVSDDQDVLFLPAEAAACMARVWEHLASARDRFDVCELETLPSDSALLRFPPSAAFRARPPLDDGVRPVLRLERGSLEQVVPPGMRRDVAYCRRRAERDGLTPRVERADAANLDRLFGDLVDLHYRRWADRGMLPLRLVAFHREVAARLQVQALLRLYVLYLGQSPAAAFYGFHAGRRTLYYLGGFDPRFSRYSPGALVIAHALEQAVVRDAAAEFDFLRGAEAYKYAWGAVDEPVHRLVVEPVHAG